MPCDRPILVVEDEAAAREAITCFLGIHGYKAVGVENGQKALEYLRNSDPPCLIVLDLILPIMDGCEFRRHQLQEPRWAAIPVVILSGAGDVQGETASLKAAGFVHKPVEAATLLGLVRLFAVPQKPGILVVADRGTVGNLLAAALQHQGFTVFHASGKEEAMDLCRRHQKTVALILFDQRSEGRDAPRILAALRDLRPDLTCGFLGDRAADELQALGATPVSSGLAEVPGLIR